MNLVKLLEREQSDAEAGNYMQKIRDIVFTNYKALVTWYGIFSTDY